MIRGRISWVLAVLLAVAAITFVHADVKTQEKSQVKFEGALGRMFGLFGGKAAREGIVSTVAVKGDRKMTVNEYTGVIVDLAEQKVYELDMRKKEYRVITFAELRRQMQEAREKAEKDAQKSGAQKKEEGEKEYEVDFDVKDTGQKKTINGFDCRQVVIAITVREKGKTLEQSGGVLLTADSWLGPKMPAMKEVAEFDLRYLQALQVPGAPSSQEQMAAAMAMFPGLREAITRFQSEKVNVDGTPVLTTVTFEGVKNQEQMAQASQEEEKPAGGVGGMLGGLGRRIAKKKPEGGDAGAKNRSTIMTMNNEVLSVATSVAPTDLQIPAGFKQK
jgi:hypothetical protein